MITDHQWHWVPSDLVEQLARRSAPPRAHYVDDGYDQWCVTRHEVP